MAEGRKLPPESWPSSLLVGRCQSCRHSGEKPVAGAVGVHLFCNESGRSEYTRPNWRCDRYEYEPGSLG